MSANKEKITKFLRKKKELLSPKLSNICTQFVWYVSIVHPSVKLLQQIPCDLYENSHKYCKTDMWGNEKEERADKKYVNIQNFQYLKNVSNHEPDLFIEQQFSERQKTGINMTTFLDWLALNKNGLGCVI